MPLSLLKSKGEVKNNSHFCEFMLGKAWSTNQSMCSSLNNGSTMSYYIEIRQF